MEWMKDGRRIIMAKDGALYFGIKLKDGENFTSFSTNCLIGVVCGISKLLCIFY